MKCPHCEKEVSPEFNVCPWCGYRPKKCSKPEHQDVWLPTDARYCPRCGEPLESKNTLEDERANSRTAINEDYPNEDLEFDVDGVSFMMVYVEGGTFMMGAQSEDEDDDNYDPDADEDETVHEVSLSDFHIGETPVTQELWEAIMGDNPSEHEGYDKPVDGVCWSDCQDFIKKLNKKLCNQLPQGCKFRLPTEAQWEFAARGGNDPVGCLYSGSDDIDDVAWYESNSDDESQPVMEKISNELGLYDMSGNVWEWCNDWYGAYNSAPQTNPTGPAHGSDRVLRGGGWYNVATFCRVSYRCYDNPGSCSGNGFRLALSK